MGPRAGLEGRKISSPPGFDPGPSSPTSVAIPTGLPGPQKDQCIKKKTGAQNTVKEMKQYQKSGYNMHRGWTQTDYQNKHYNINRKDEGT